MEIYVYFTLFTQMYKGISQEQIWKNVLEF